MFSIFILLQLLLSDGKTIVDDDTIKFAALSQNSTPTSTEIVLIDKHIDEINKNPAQYGKNFHQALGLKTYAFCYINCLTTFMQVIQYKQTKKLRLSRQVLQYQLPLQA